MRKRHIFTWFIVVTLVMMIAAVQAGNWEKLGARTVNYNVDRDVILVGEKEGTFTAIKLAVNKAGIHVLDMKVHFMNGDVMDVEIRSFIPKNGETRIIDLPGKNRMIEKVVFWYKTPAKKGKAARVRLWGRH
ncbi:hypothetical protein JW948_06665 [bacterium]|nr:hypothetical protein [bacterium]